MNRLTGLQFDAYVASYYVNKIKSCEERKIEFKLTLQQVRNMLSAKKCQLIGIDLTHTDSSPPNRGLQRASDVTIDRLNSSRPYETGNVCACSVLANQLKNSFEMKFDGNGDKALSILHLMSDNLRKRGF